MLSPVQNTLLKTLSAFIKGEKYTPESEVDYEKLLEESISQAVVLSCAQGLNLSVVPERNLIILKKYAIKSLQTNAKINAQHDYIHQLLTENQINYVILKGSASAFYYPDPIMRSMGDVDIWVDHTQISQTEKILIDDGFLKHEMCHESHLVFKKDKLHLELHKKPAGLPDNEYGEILKQYLKDIFEKKLLVSCADNYFYKPSDFHHGLIILMHTYHHLLSEGIGLRHLSDWAVFVNTFEEESFSKIYKDKLTKVGLWHFAKIISYVCYKYLNIRYCEWMGNYDTVLIEQVIEDVFAGGNFGSKEKGRSVQGLMISARGKDGVKKGNFFQLLSSANHLAKTQFTTLAKIPILKHFCFVPLGIRYIFRIITGKRKKMNIVSNVKQANLRKQIYEQFKLFEVEEK